MSPLLFLLVIEVLSKLIQSRRSEGRLRGINISNSKVITHLFFVDDILIFGFGSVGEWKEYNDIFQVFCQASGMEDNLQNSSFIYNNVVVISLRYKI